MIGAATYARISDCSISGLNVRGSLATSRTIVGMRRRAISLSMGNAASTGLSCLANVWLTFSDQSGSRRSKALAGTTASSWIRNRIARSNPQRSQTTCVQRLIMSSTEPTVRNSASARCTEDRPATRRSHDAFVLLPRDMCQLVGHAHDLDRVGPFIGERVIPHLPERVVDAR